MNDYEKIREQIINMQSWASHNPLLHKELLIQLHRTRSELEKLWIKTK